MKRLTKKVENRYIITCPNLLKYIDGKNQLNEFLFAQDKGIQKLGELEDIEDELGIDLATYFKIKSAKSVYVQELGGDYSEMLVRPSKDNIDVCYKGFVNIPECDSCLKLKDYGKTWALTKEELENNRIANVLDKAIETATNKVIEREALKIIKKHGLSQPHLNLILQSENYGLYRRIIVGSQNDVFKYEIPYSRDEFKLIKVAFRIEE